MTSLICETTSGLNSLQQSFIAFFVIMTIVGFILIYIDKKRWKEHTKRSAEMLAMKSRKNVDVPSELADADAQSDEQSGKKSKKKSKKKNDDVPAHEYEYEGRIKDRILVVVAVFCGGFGELLGMVFCRHKWYKAYFKIGMPLIALMNIAFIVIVVFAVAGINSNALHFTT